MIQFSVCSMSTMEIKQIADAPVDIGAGANDHGVRAAHPHECVRILNLNEREQCRTRRACVAYRSHARAKTIVPIKGLPNRLIARARSDDFVVFVHRTAKKSRSRSSYSITTFCPSSLEGALLANSKSMFCVPGCGAQKSAAF